MTTRQRRKRSCKEKLVFVQSTLHAMSFLLYHLGPQIFQQLNWSHERRRDEVTYYNRACTAQDQTTRNRDDLFSYTTDQAEENMLKQLDANVKNAKKKGKKKKVKNPDHVHESVGQGKAIRYLETWANDRGNWKFEKCRQIWLLQNCYDSVKIPDDKYSRTALFRRPVCADLCWQIGSEPIGRAYCYARV